MLRRMLILLMGRGEFGDDHVYVWCADFLMCRCAPPQGKGAISLEGDVQQAAALAVGITVPPPQTPVACYVPAPMS
jgi:hypothetical protein